MALSTKTIKRRIKSIGNTKKITKAMEMISAVKMRRAVGNVLGTRSYANLAWEMLQDIAKRTDIRLHPLLHQRPVKTIGMIYITSNRGLAGGFNSRLLQEAHKYIVEAEGVTTTVIPTERHSERRNPLTVESQSSSDSSTPSTAADSARNDKRSVEVQIILTGKKGKKLYQRFGHRIAAEYPKEDLTTKIEEIMPLVQQAILDYTNGVYDKIVVAYTDFVSAVQQIPRVKQILPLTEMDLAGGWHHLMQELWETEEPTPGWQEGAEEIEPSPSQRACPEQSEGRGQGEVSLDQNIFLFEPGAKEVLNVLLPRLVETQVYQTILESDASEHSARMMAMRNASDAAEDIIKELNYSFNKARQGAITREIAEIVGGAAALE
ncbi:MAG: F0F1 ATP synthase subunit gamma [Candidatus Magasanikbacteria bacterium]|nr:F0F1 ATP synthase subunit gamma [Candidatus Magasanikbacteria bacterium]